MIIRNSSTTGTIDGASTIATDEVENADSRINTLETEVNQIQLDIEGLDLVTSLSDLTDTTITGTPDNQLLVATAGEWYNGTISEIDGGDYDSVGSGIIVSGPTFAGNELTTWEESSGHLLPTADITYDIGSPTNRVRDLYLSSSTLYLGNNTVSVADGELRLNGSPVQADPDWTNIQNIPSIFASDWSQVQNIPIALAQKYAPLDVYVTFYWDANDQSRSSLSVTTYPYIDGTGTPSTATRNGVLLNPSGSGNTSNGFITNSSGNGTRVRIVVDPRTVRFHYTRYNITQSGNVRPDYYQTLQVYKIEAGGAVPDVPTESPSSNAGGWLKAPTVLQPNQSTTGTTTTFIPASSTSQQYYYVFPANATIPEPYYTGTGSWFFNIENPTDHLRSMGIELVVNAVSSLASLSLS